MTLSALEGSVLSLLIPSRLISYGIIVDVDQKKQVEDSLIVANEAAPPRTEARGECNDAVHYVPTTTLV